MQIQHLAVLNSLVIYHIHSSATHNALIENVVDKQYDDEARTMHGVTSYPTCIILTNHE